MLREVILIKAQKETVMAGRYVELRQVVMSYPPLQMNRVAGSDEMVFTEEVIECPVHEMHRMNDRGDVESDFIALDPLMQKFYTALENSLAESRAEAKRLDVELMAEKWLRKKAEKRLEAIETASFGERLKRLFTGWSNKQPRQ